ncbi:MAG TPA: hypothetical protein PKI03_14320 [Pseudomonadota bacterium]|nr:hypothetical protein [Pseudomonadota bacterium]
MATLKFAGAWRAAAALWAVLAGTAACGTQGDASVLPDRWPRSGLSGYRFVDADAPYALGRFGWDLDEPAILASNAPAGSSADTVEIWGRMSPRLSPEKTVLFRASLPVAKLNAEAEPDEVLAAEAAWEGAGLRSPAPVRLAGSDGKEQILLFYQGAAGDVGLAVVKGDTVEKVSQSAPLWSASELTGSAGAKLGRVAVVAADERVSLFFSVDDRDLRVADCEQAALLRYLAAPDARPPLRLGPTLLTASATPVPPGDSKAMPAERIAQAAVRRQVTPVGRVRWDVALNGQAGRETVLLAASAYAAADDPARVGPVTGFLPVEAALIKTMEGTVGAPAFTTVAGRQLLFFGLRSVASQVAVAAQP